MIRIITDSVASLPDDVVATSGVEVMTLFVNRDGTEYRDADMDLDAFYADIDAMVDNIPTSSQPSQSELEAAFEDAARAGDEVLGIWISSGLSGTLDGALRAARSVEARNIGFKYIMVDSASCGFDEAFPVLEGIRAVKAGGSLEEAAETVVEAVRSTRFLFTPDNLTFLQKGGRIGNAAAMVGNMIQLSPILTVSDGKATTFKKVRVRKRALAHIVDQLKSDIDSKGGLCDLVVHYIGDSTPAIEWSKKVIEPLIGWKPRVLPVSPVIGLHVGPAIGIAYQCRKALEGKFIDIDPQRLIHRS